MPPAERMPRLLRLVLLLLLLLLVVVVVVVSWSCHVARSWLGLSLGPVLHWSWSSLLWFLTCFLRLLGSVYRFWQPITSHRYGFYITRRIYPRQYNARKFAKLWAEKKIIQ